MIPAFCWDFTEIHRSLTYGSHFVCDSEFVQPKKCSSKKIIIPWEEHGYVFYTLTLELKIERSIHSELMIFLSRSYLKFKKLQKNFQIENQCFTYYRALFLYTRLFQNIINQLEKKFQRCNPPNKLTIKKLWQISKILCCKRWPTFGTITRVLNEEER